MEIIDLANYEYIHHRDSDGSEYLTLTHESGFASYSESFKLNNNEIEAIKLNKNDFIKRCRSSFDHSNKQFNYIKRNRIITDI